MIKYFLSLMKKHIDPKDAVMIFNNRDLSRNKYSKLLKKAGFSIKKSHIVKPVYFCFGNVEIGEGSFVNTDCKFIDDAPIVIGDNCGIGPGVHIYTATHPLNYQERVDTNCVTAPVIIRDKVWVGGGAIILPGVTLGEGSVIAAGSVVTKDTEPYCLYAGNPAVFKKKIE